MTDMNYYKVAIFWMFLGMIVNPIRAQMSDDSMRTARFVKQKRDNLNLVLAEATEVATVFECSRLCLTGDYDGFAFCKSTPSTCFPFNHSDVSTPLNGSQFSFTSCSFYVGNPPSTTSGKTTTAECINVTGGGCTCPNGVTDPACNTYLHFQDCYDYLMYNSAGTGLLYVKPKEWTGNAFMVRCFEGSTFIQMRENLPSCHSMSFNLSWAAYSEGFGDIENGCFWLGNDKISALTKSFFYDLIVEAEINSTLEFIIGFGSFVMKNSSNYYSMSYSGGYDGAVYANGLDGPGTDQDVDGEEFYTYDRDRNGCAAASGGGWWYAAGCAYGNLNNNSRPYWPIKSQLSVLESSRLSLQRY